MSLHPGRSHGVHEAFVELVEQQAGIITRAQAEVLGLTAAQIRSHVAARRWHRLTTGVFATFTGPVPTRARIWAALLAAGEGAALTGRTALWLAGALPDPGSVVIVLVPHDRVLRRSLDADVRRCRGLSERLHPVAQPSMVRVEEALLDETERLPEPEAIACLLQVLQRRATTAGRLSAALDRRPRHRHRRLLEGLLADTAEGAASILEYRYLHDVERRHGLPRGRRNELTVRVTNGGRPRRSRPDVRYDPWGLVVELDGAAYHPEHLRHLDRVRDNDTVLAGDRTLRAGWYEVTAHPCGTASQVGRGLRLGGWRGVARRCGPHCTIDPVLLTEPPEE